ncbi:hypothetical protein FRX31_018838 [Thalictrum thalictroides]|uniref:Uncharacterized protein n=1 Tax=Thalictrum thalictroides TaxID=46969 RepID=A0A7J6W5G6_THATH|nr:hypothetical protein FRX31_018838 [Thalictrum thalictroides]
MVKVEAYQRAYNFSVFPIPNDIEWNQPQYVVKPPPLERPTGRPKGKRIRGEDEPQKTTNKVRRCSLCRSTKHTKATCKGLSVTEIKARGGKTKSKPRGHGMDKTKGVVEQSEAGGIRGRGSGRPKGTKNGAGRGKGSRARRGTSGASQVDNEPRPWDYQSFDAFTAAFGPQVE